MGAGNPYSDVEVTAISRVMLEKEIPLPPYGQGKGNYGVTFWSNLAEDGELPDILVKRINSGGDIPKFLKANKERVEAEVKDLRENFSVRLVLSSSDSDSD